MRAGRVGQVDELAELAEPAVGRVLVVGDEAGRDEVGLREPGATARPPAPSPPARPRRRAGRTHSCIVCAGEERFESSRRSSSAGTTASQRAPVRVAEARDRDPTVARLRRAGRAGRSPVCCCVGARSLGPAVGTDPRVGVEVHATVHDRRVDELTLAGALAPVERHEHRERRLHRARLVAHPEAVPVRPVALAAELLLEPARRLRELVEARPRRARPVAAPHRRVAVDDVGLSRLAVS